MSYRYLLNFGAHTTFNNTCTNNMSVTFKLSGTILFSFDQKWVPAAVFYSLKNTRR